MRSRIARLLGDPGDNYLDMHRFSLTRLGLRLSRKAKITMKKAYFCFFFILSYPCFVDASLNAVHPNVIIIYVDDMGWKDLQSYGSTFYETPHIDGLADAGVKFTDAYAAAPVCSPSRASLLTGKYPARLHFTNVMGESPGPTDRPLLSPNLDDKLHTSELTLAEAFKNGGYSTAAIGKWHVDWIGPTSHGFDIAPLISTQGGNDPPVIDNNDPKEVTEITDRAIDFIRDSVNANDPFFLYMSHYTVHVRLETTQVLHDKYDAKPVGENGQKNPYMGGMIEDLDAEIGRLLDELDALNITDNTIIVFTSDNGGLTEQFGPVTSNKPLRGGKGNPYEGGHRVPLIIKGPGVNNPNRETSTVTVTPDLYPTLLEMAGLPLEPSQHVDGASLMPILSNTGTVTREAIYFHYPHYRAGNTPTSAVRKGDYKLIKYHEEEISPCGGPGKELYNLSADIGETNNLALWMPSKVDELNTLLDDHLSSVGAQMPTANPNYDACQYWLVPIFNLILEE